MSWRYPKRPAARYFQIRETDMKQPRYLILLDNGGGELDRREAHNAQSCKMAVADLVRSIAYFSGGDTIKIIDREEPRE